MTGRELFFTKTINHSDYTTEELSVWKIDEDGEDRYEVRREMTTSFNLSEDEFAEFIGNGLDRLITDDDPCEGYVWRHSHACDH